jgi:hypothetical protein
MRRRWAAKIVLAAGLAAVFATASHRPPQTATPQGYYGYCLIDTATSIPDPTPTDPCHTLPKVMGAARK